MYRIGCESREMQEALWRVIEEESRRRLERTLNATMEWERELFLGVRPYERNAVRRGYRNGFDERVLDSRQGPLKLRIPKVRRSGEAFRTRVVRAYQRRRTNRRGPGINFCAPCGIGGWWRSTVGESDWNTSSATATAAWKPPSH